jgi:integral membrane protein (TIGR01906 family)
MPSAFICVPVPFALGAKEALGMVTLVDAGARLRRIVTSRWLRRAGAAVFVVSVPLALVGSNVRLLFGEQRLYTFAVNRYADPAITGVTRPEMLRATRQLREYLLGPDQYLRIDVTDTAGQRGPLFNPREVLHMRDVKRLVQGIFHAQQAALVVAIGYPAARMALQGRQGAQAVARITWLTTAVFNLAAVAFAVSAVLGFDRIFTRFHQLSFSNDLWMLDPERDRLVQLFPFEFWQIASGLLIGLTLAESLLLSLGARLYLARSERGMARGQSVSAEEAPAPATSDEAIA